MDIALAGAHAHSRTRVRDMIAGAGAVFFLSWAAFYLLTTLCAIVNFSFRQPMFDQWRMYETLLKLPFPDNVLQLENGHRPIIPNLFRIAEIHWFAADQMVQITVGTMCAVLTWFAFAATTWRQRDLPLLARAVGVLIATLGVLWLANARMLLHGNESLHVYLLTLAVAAAALCTYRAYERHSLGWYATASGALVTVRVGSERDDSSSRRTTELAGEHKESRVCSTARLQKHVTNSGDAEMFLIW